MATIVNDIPPRWRGLSAEQTASADVKTPQVVLDFDSTKRDGGWADPPDWTAVDFSTRTTHAEEGTLFVDDKGRPLNPAGPTGKAGRILGKWGPNQAADPVVLRPAADGFEMLAIERQDTGAWAIPGGMVDAGEDARTAAARELREECGVTLDFASAHVLFAGVVANDPRNTDHAWMETTVAVVVVDADATFKLKAGDDARRAQWLTLSEEALGRLYADHATFVRLALAWAAAE